MVNLFKGLLVILFLLSCEPDGFVADNPYDPDNPEYIPPIVSIVSGPIDGQTIATESIEFTYSGNEPMLFRTRLDTNLWSGWSNANSITLDHLDEGDHTFFLQGKFATNDTSEILPVLFTVDAVQGPALMFFPRRHITDLGQNITFKIIAEEVYDLAGTEFILEYENSMVSIENVLPGDIFSEIGDPIFFYEDKPSEGKLVITSAVWGTGEPSYTGTAVVAEVSMQIIQVGEINIIFDGTELFRDPQNQSIGINATVDGLIESN